MRTGLYTEIREEEAMSKKATTTQHNANKAARKSAYNERLLALGRASQKSQRKSMSQKEVLQYVAEQRGGRA